ncbi:hypothetical protein L7F22_029798 [Adiantum nelumboides]|nr:hypothetical protein [Adiantum nelumboides]
MSDRGRQHSHVYYTRAQGRAGNIDPFHYEDNPEDARIDQPQPPDEQLLTSSVESFGASEGRAMRQLVGALLMTGGPARSRRSSKRETKESKSGSESDTSSSAALDSESSSDEEEKKKHKKSPNKKNKDKAKDEVDLIQQLKSIGYLVIAPKNKRSKAKRPIDWEQQKGVRDRVQKQVQKEQQHQITSAKPPRENACSQNQSAKDGLNDGDGTAPKRGRTSEAKAKVKEEDEDNANKVMWKDFLVEHLIHIRGGMNDEFNRMPKQGIDLLGKVATKLASMFADCDKDGQACRKKWARVNKHYREDKAHNAILGNDRKRSCKWYDIVEYMHDRANVVCKSHASSIGKEFEPGQHG